MALTKVQTEMAGTGAVLQVVSSNYSTPVTSSTNTFIDSGLTATITPKSANSKILVLVSINDIEKGVGDTYATFLLYRNAVNVTTFSSEASYSGNTNTNSTGVSCNYLDSPSTTSATVYKVQFRSSANTARIILNPGSATSSQITLMEIAG